MSLQPPGPQTPQRNFVFPSAATGPSTQAAPTPSSPPSTASLPGPREINYITVPSSTPSTTATPTGRPWTSDSPSTPGVRLQAAQFLTLDAQDGGTPVRRFSLPYIQGGTAMVPAHIFQDGQGTLEMSLPLVPWEMSSALGSVHGAFFRSPPLFNQRSRVQQACDRCRERKAKCTGNRPSCARCQNRGIMCEYSNENRPRRSSTKPARRGSTASDSKDNSPPKVSPISSPRLRADQEHEGVRVKTEMLHPEHAILRNGAALSTSPDSPSHRRYDSHSDPSDDAHDHHFLDTLPSSASAFNLTASRFQTPPRFPSPNLLGPNGYSGSERDSSYATEPHAKRSRHQYSSSMSQVETTREIGNPYQNGQHHQSSNDLSAPQSVYNGLYGNCVPNQHLRGHHLAVPSPPWSDSPTFHSQNSPAVNGHWGDGGYRGMHGDMNSMTSSPSPSSGVFAYSPPESSTRQSLFMPRGLQHIDVTGHNEMRDRHSSMSSNSSAPITPDRPNFAPHWHQQQGSHGQNVWQSTAGIQRNWGVAKEEPNELGLYLHGDDRSEHGGGIFHQGMTPPGYPSSFVSERFKRPRGDSSASMLSFGFVPEIDADYVDRQRGDLSKEEEEAGMISVTDSQRTIIAMDDPVSVKGHSPEGSPA